MSDHGGGEDPTAKQTAKDLLVVADIYSAAALQQQLQLQFLLTQQNRLLSMSTTSSMGFSLQKFRRSVPHIPSRFLMVNGMVCESCIV